MGRYPVSRAGLRVEEHTLYEYNTSKDIGISRLKRVADVVTVTVGLVIRYLR